MVRFFDRRWLAALAGLGCVAAVFAFMSGPSRAATKKSCKGTPAAYSVVLNLSNTTTGAQTSPDIVGGFRAAAAAINKSCQLGRPIKIVACDDKNTPNGAADCGRRAVAAKAFGVTAYSASGDAYAAPVVAAKIPILPFTSSSATESTSKLSFPFGDPITVVLATLPGVKAVGAKRLALLHLDVPGVGFFVNLVKKQAGLFGMQIAGDVPVPVTATDMTTYVAQALAAKPQAMSTIVAPSALSAIFKQVRAQGSKIQLISGANVITKQTIKSLPNNVTNGLLVTAWTVDPNSPSDRGNRAVKQFLRELKAAKQPGSNATANGLAAWGTMHSVADALKAKRLAPTATNVPRALLTGKMPKITTKYGMVPRDFRKNAFASNDTLKNFRIFSNTVYYYRLNAKRQPIRVVSKPVSILKTPKFIK